MAVGKVIIGTRLDTKQLEKDLKNSEKELQKYEKESEKLTEAKAKIDVDVSNAEKELDNLNEKIKRAYQKMKNEQAKVKEIPSWKKDTEEYQQQYESMEKAISKYNDLLLKEDKLSSKLELRKQKQNEINKKIESSAVSQSMLNDKIQETSQKLKQVKGFENIKDKIEDVNKGLTKTVKKVGKWALALFGVRSAYNAIRSAMSTLSQYDDQMASNIEYITYALANTLKPVIETILNLVVKLLQYINYIVKAWTGKNLFKIADAFKNAQKNAKGLNKELQKTTASFDEINTVGSSSGSSDTSTSGGANIDLTGLPEGEIPGWVQWLADNGETLKNIIIGIGAAIAGIKLANFIKDLGLLGEAFSSFKTLLLGLGIGLIIYGIYETITSIVEFIKDPSWENFANILQGLTIILAGVAIAMLAVNAANPVAWIILAIAAVVALAAVIIKHWDEIKEVLGKVGQWIYDHIIKPVADFFVGLWQGIKDGVGNAVQWVKDKFNSIVSFFSNLISKIVGLFKTIGTKVGDAIGGAFKAVINGVLKAIENILNFPIKSINKLIGVINKVPGINLGKLPTFSLPRLAKGGIINQPGRGVPVGYGQAIGGEHGAEGVIPFTDSQQMALIGETIGRYVNINLTNVTKLDNRQIAKEQRRINAQNDFAFNR